MDTSQNYADLLEPGIRSAKKRLDSKTQNGSALSSEMNRRKKLKKIKQKYGGYASPRSAPQAQWENDPNS